MWKNASILIWIASIVVFSGAAQAAHDVTSPLDTVVGVPDDGDWPPNELPPFAVDDQVLTKYLHFKGGNQPTGIRVTPVAGPTVVIGLTFTTANDAGYRDPVTYELSGSNVSINGPYTLIASGPIVDFAGGAEWPRRTKNTTPILFANATAYEHYQLLFPTTRDPATEPYMQIAEVELLAPDLKATNPSPTDGATGVAGPLLSWTAGDTTIWHDVYLGTNPTPGAAEFKARQPLAWAIWFEAAPWTPGQTYYWRIDEVEADGTTIHTGDVWSFTAASLTAYDPNPKDGAKWVDTEANLMWTSGTGALSHDVYFGTDENAVADGTGGTSKGNQLGNMYDPGTLLEDTTYYWRIDERNGTLQTGDVWSFTTTGAGGGIKGEYFSNVDLSGMPALVRIDPEVNFDWADQSPDASIPADGWSARWTADLEIALADTYTFHVNSQDGTRLWIGGEPVIDMWVAWVTTEYASLPIYLEKGIYPLRLEFFDSGGDAVQQLSWSTSTMAKQIIPAGPLQPPLRAGSPNPPDGAVNVTQTPTLRWAPGEDAAQHDVYFGTDETAVANADTTTVGIYRGRQNDASYVPPEAPLEWDHTYYWKVNEVNGVDLWEGSVWSFTTADYIIVDDFEDYDDFCNRIFYAWEEGGGYNQNVECGIPPSNGNGTGSLGGYAAAPYAEQTITHNGSFQSMPFEYVNDGSTGKALYSETERTFDPAQDWTVGDVKALSLWFYGGPGNAAEQLYVAVEDSVGRVHVANHPDLEAVQVAAWQEWNIELREFSNATVDLAAVKKMYIGMGNRLSPQAGGTGTIFIDDIRVYPSRCVASLPKPDADLSGNCVVDYADVEILADQWLNSGLQITPVNPGTANLVAHYPFEGNANDVVGGNNGTAVGFVTYPAGKVGQAIKLDAADLEYVDCGADPSLNITGPITISAWIRLSAAGTAQKIAGNQDAITGGYKFAVFSDNTVEFEIRTSDNAAILNRDVAGGTALIPGVWYHVTGVYSEGNYIRTYVNGTLDRELITSEILGSSTGTLQFGREPYPDAAGDYTAGYFDGLIDEIRIYSVALSDVQVLWLAGRTSPFSEPFDLDQDGTVDSKDFAVLADSWLDEALWP